MQASGNAEEFIESVKVDLFPDKVYVFTPKGAILRLPRGATVVDFAYAVHTDIGNRCVRQDQRGIGQYLLLHPEEVRVLLARRVSLPDTESLEVVATMLKLLDKPYEIRRESV